MRERRAGTVPCLSLRKAYGYLCFYYYSYQVWYVCVFVCMYMYVEALDIFFLSCYQGWCMCVFVYTHMYVEASDSFFLTCS